jgi:hypothetical protein
MGNLRGQEEQPVRQSEFFETTSEGPLPNGMFADNELAPGLAMLLAGGRHQRLQFSLGSTSKSRNATSTKPWRGDTGPQTIGALRTSPMVTTDTGHSRTYKHQNDAYDGKKLARHLGCGFVLMLPRPNAEDGGLSLKLLRNGSPPNTSTSEY